MKMDELKTSKKPKNKYEQAAEEQLQVQEPLKGQQVIEQPKAEQTEQPKNEIKTKAQPKAKTQQQAKKDEPQEQPQQEQQQGEPKDEPKAEPQQIEKPTILVDEYHMLVGELIGTNEGQKGKSKNLYLDNKVLEAVKEIADNRGVSESRVVNELLKHVLFGGKLKV